MFRWIVLLLALPLAACGTLSSRTGSDVTNVPVSASEPAAAEPQAVADVAAPPSADQSPTGEPAELLPWEVEEEETYDPFEKVNRKVYAFNSFLDRNFLEPVAQGYEKVMPQVVRTGIGNFFRNLFEPTMIINGLLQGKFAQAGSDTGRFIANSTFGVLGLFDVATGWGMPRHNEDFGQTLGVWGMPDGAYIVLPFFGPHTTRDTLGWFTDWFTDPVTYVKSDAALWTARGVYYVDLRSQYLGASKVLEQATDDEYLFFREAYVQRRKSLIKDNGQGMGQPAEPVLP